MNKSTSTLNALIPITAIGLSAIVLWILISPLYSTRLEKTDLTNQQSAPAVSNAGDVSVAKKMPQLQASPSRGSESTNAEDQTKSSTISTKQISLDSSVNFSKIQITVEKGEMEAEAFRVGAALMAKRPNDANAVHVAALCNSQLHMTTEAQNLWLRCIELSPKTETFYLNVAANALYRGETELALDTLEKAIANGLDSADISHHMGLALAKLGEDEKAVEVLKKAVQKQPALAGHWMLLGQSELKLNRLEDAKISLNRAVELGVRNRAVYLALLNTSARLGDKAAAGLYREKIEESADQSVSDGREQFRAHSEKDAKRVLVTVLGEAGVVYRDVGMFESAEHTALRLLALEPNNYGTCVFLADMYHSRDMQAEELATRQRMLELNPSDLVNHLRAARILSDAGYPKRCEAAVKAVTTLAPQSALGFAAMAEFLVSQGLYSRAKWYAEQALERERSPGGLKLLETIDRELAKRSVPK